MNIVFHSQSFLAQIRVIKCIMTNVHIHKKIFYLYLILKSEGLCIALQ